MRLNYAVTKRYPAAKRQRKLRLKEIPPAAKRQRKLRVEGDTECKEAESAEDGCSQTEAEKEVIRAFRVLLNGFEEQWSYAAQQESVSSESEAEECQCHLYTSSNEGAAITRRRSGK